MREDWIQSSLEDLSDYEIGGDWGKDPEFVDENFIDIYCIRGSEFRNWQRDKGSTASQRKVKINSFNSRKLLLNDILVEISGGGPDQPVGRTVIIDNEVLSHFKGKNLMFTNFLRLVRSNHLVNSFYINQYLKYFYSTGEIVKYQAGSNNLRNLKFGDFMKIKLPLPPLPEQRAIVKKIESLFSSLDAGVADLKKAQQQLKIYRQAVLKKAFEGELTKEWRSKQNSLPNNDELLKLINDERENYYQIQLEEWQMAISDLEKNSDSERKPVKPKLSKPLNPITKDEFIDDLFEIPTNWIWDRLENLIFEVKDGTHDTPKYQEKGIPFITQKNIKNNDITFDNIQFISNLDHQKFFARSNVKRNDIIMAMIGHNRGTCTIVKTDIVFSIKNVALFKFFEQIQLNKYFLYFFQFTGGLEIILKKSKGGAQPFIGLTELRNWPIPYCSFLEQSQIVKQIESRLSVCDSIEQNIKESLIKAEGLRQSILKKAFEGSLLTIQELEKCKLAEDYEPAGVLLERIKADQNKATAKPSKKKVAQPLVAAKTDTSVAKISADIHAGLIAKIIKIHEENPASIDNLSHIKCEKIAHLVEYHLQIPLGRQPVKDAAGPDDYPHLKKIEHRAKMTNYFAIQKKDIGYSYSSAKNSDKAIEKFQSAFSIKKNNQLDDLIALFLKFDLEVSEIIATTYAGWNNLILNGNTIPSDEEIVYESRENWSERKLTIARERFFKAIEWMRKNEIVPTGYGAVVPFPKKKK
jgi:type I restriction enzyme, S subunit